MLEHGVVDVENLVVPHDVAGVQVQRRGVAREVGLEAHGHATAAQEVLAGVDPGAILGDEVLALVSHGDDLHQVHGRALLGIHAHEVC